MSIYSVIYQGLCPVFSHVLARLAVTVSHSVMEAMTHGAEPAVFGVLGHTPGVILLIR